MVLGRFLPRDERFFQHFEAATANAADAARLLGDIVTSFSDIERKARQMRDYEHRGDEITHQVFSALNRTFVTPLDREDIRYLISQLDNFLDYIEDVSSRLHIYRIQASTEPARLIARIITEQAEILVRAVPLLEHRKRQDELMRHIVEIHRLENEADDALNRALATLYDGASDIPTLISAIRWGEIYQLMEDATDQAEDVANALEAIVLKNA